MSGWLDRLAQAGKWQRGVVNHPKYGLIETEDPRERLWPLIVEALTAAEEMPPALHNGNIQVVQDERLDALHAALASLRASVGDGG